MKPEERNAPVADWRLTDPHLQALERRRAEDWAWRDRVHTIDTRDAPVAGDADVHRAVAADLLKGAIDRYEPLGAVECQRAHAAYEERRKVAQLEVKLAERLGEPVPEEIRRLAATPSRQVAVDRVLAQRQASRTEALREANRSVRGRDDGSHVPAWYDPQDWLMAEEQTLVQIPQVARHRQMAEGKVPDVRLRRRGGWAR